MKRVSYLANVAAAPTGNPFRSGALVITSRGQLPTATVLQGLEDHRFKKECRNHWPGNIREAIQPEALLYAQVSVG